LTNWKAFVPEGTGMYRRVLVTVNSGQMPFAAWAYDGSPIKLRLKSRINNGLWKGI